MKFVADECCDASLVEKLRALGYDVLYIAEDNPGITDTRVLAKAFAEKKPDMLAGAAAPCILVVVRPVPPPAEFNYQYFR